MAIASRLGTRSVDRRSTHALPLVASQAQLGGLRLCERWDGWSREPFTSESRQHVSIWQKPAS